MLVPFFKLIKNNENAWAASTFFLVGVGTGTKKQQKPQSEDDMKETSHA